MNRCEYCNGLNGRCDADCPEQIMEKRPRQQAMNQWEDGFADGIAGEPQRSEDAHYLLGHRQGAAEEPALAEVE